MDAKQAIQKTLNLSMLVLKTYIDDLSDAELMNRPAPGCNHLAWQLGHLLRSEENLLNTIQPGTASLPAGFAEKYGPEAKGSDNPADFHTKAEYLRLFDELNAAAQQLLESYPAADFDQAAPESLRNFLPTMGDIWILIAQHPMMHAGQFVPVRRQLGKPIKI